MDTEFQDLLKIDNRYKTEAYQFVFESLDYAQKRLKMGRQSESEEIPEEDSREKEKQENHITGQELCLAAKMYALDMYGFMAKTVLKNWGIQSTSDFGNIVYNMIKIGRMRKTSEDKLEDFDNVYDFVSAFDENYQMGTVKKNH
ncbi:MAG: hypothetical protein LBQ54_04220 [Planctomycetaceae bacterium]|jgi:uncharacterized repeat protein (TIGR04138 family)|nr:hypothetical protein [Planctomycetaceae bacterium]